MSTVNGFQAGSETLKYNYESLENYNTPNFSSSSSKVYAIGDYVMYNGKLYKCTTATTGGTWNVNNWAEAILTDDVTEQKNAISQNTEAISELDDVAYVDESIVDLPSTSLTTWAGMAKAVVINDFPISGISGNVEIDYYTNAGNETEKIWFILYEFSGGILTLVAKKDAQSKTVSGVYHLDTGWTVDRSKTYYIGLWNENSGRVKQITGDAATIPVVFKYNAYADESAITIGSTLEKSQLNRVTDRTIFYNITIKKSIADDVESNKIAINELSDRVDVIEEKLTDESVKVVDLPTDSPFVWLGMSGRVMLNEKPIINLSGSVIVDFYAKESSNYSLLLYELTAPGVITLINKYDFSTSSERMMMNLVPGWTVRNDKIYYVALYAEESNKFYMSQFQYYTYYGSVAAADLNVGTTLNISNIYATNVDRSLLLNITVQKDGKDYPKPHIKRYCHFSVDDCVFWADLIANGDTYVSAFENPVLKLWKRMHDMYGVTVTLNCFCSDGTNSIADVPTKFATEFAENVDWLRFAFHAQDSETSYSTDKVSEIAASYDTFVDAIIAMTGTPDAIDSVTRLGFYSGTLNNCVAIRDTACGISGLLTSDDTRNSYYLDSADNTFILAHNWLHDTENHLLFIHTLKRLESASYQSELSNIFDSKDVHAQSIFLEVFTHETLVQNVYEKISQYALWFIEKGVEFAFAEDVAILG